MNNLEDALQKAVVEVLRMSPDLRVCAIPNGGKRNTKEAARMKGLGVLAGVSDLLVVWAPWKVAMIELKAPGKVTGKKRPLASLSASQREWYDTMKEMGHYVAVCDSLDGVLNFLTACGAPVTARVL